MSNTFIALSVPNRDGSGVPAVASLTGSPKTFFFDFDKAPVGRYTVEASNDGGVTWDVLVGLDGTQVVFSASNSGPKTVDGIVDRLRVTSIGNGAVASPPSITMGAALALGTNLFGTLDVPLTDGLGPVVDLGTAAGPIKTFMMRGAVSAGSRYAVLASMDGVHFDEAVLFTSDQSGARAVEILCRFLRVQRHGVTGRPVISFGCEGTFDPASLSGSEISIGESSERETSGTTAEDVLFEYAAPLSMLSAPILAATFAGISVQGEVASNVTFRVRLGGSIGQPDGLEIIRAPDRVPAEKSILGNAPPFARPANGATLVKVTGQGDGTGTAALRGFVLLLHGTSNQPTNQGETAMSRDVAQRDLDMNGFRINNIGTANQGDVTHTDNAFTPLPSSGNGSPGGSLLAAPADHVHPASPGSGSSPIVLQVSNSSEEEVSGPTEDLVYQEYVDFSAIQSSNIKPVLSALIGVDSGDTCTFQVRLGGTPGLATDGQQLVSITAQAQGPAPTIATGTPVATPTQPTLVKVTGFTGRAGSIARIAGLRATFTG